MLEKNHLFKAIYDLFEAIMIDIHDIMNHINDIKMTKSHFYYMSTAGTEEFC